MDPRDPHPWNDPAQAPRNFDRALEHPALGVYPDDSQDFYAYQSRLAQHNQMMHDQMRGSAGGATDYAAGGSYTGPKQPRTSVPDQLIALLANLTGEGKPKLTVDIVLREFYGIIDRYQYRLDDADFDALARFVQEATDREPSVRGEIDRVRGMIHRNVAEAAEALRSAEAATIAAEERRLALAQGDHGIRRPTRHGPPLSWIPSIRKADEAALRGYETEVENAKFRARVDLPLEISSLEGQEARARTDSTAETEKLARLDRILAAADHL